MGLKQLPMTSWMVGGPTHYYVYTCVISYKFILEIAVYICSTLTSHDCTSITIYVTLNNDQYLAIYSCLLSTGSSLASQTMHSVT